MPAIERLRADDAYDLIIVAVRKNQVSSVLPLLAAHHNTPSILFMVNNPSGYDDWIKAVGSQRLLLGFPGAGGTRTGHVVRYVGVPRFLQPTTLGETDGAATPRVKTLLRVLRDAGFPTASTANMDAWQKTHVAWVSPVANAIYMVNGDNHQLARSPHAVRLVVRAVREGFQVLRFLGIPVTPARLRMWELMPEPVMVRGLSLWADTDHFRTVAVEHTLAAADEMGQLAKEFHTLAATTSIETVAMDELRSFIPRPGSELKASA